MTDPRVLEELADAYRNAAASLRELARVLRKPLHEPQGTRLQQLRTWLAKNGPATREEVRSLSGISATTIAAILVRKNFDRLPDRRWMVKQ